MSVARSAYRQLLRVGKKVSDRYRDPNDMCFALFGLLVTRQDFMNAGYSGVYPGILRMCFLRPSVRDDPHDTVSARISAAFDALRRLNEIHSSGAAFRIRELRRQMSDTAANEDGVTTAAGNGNGADSGAKARAPSTPEIADTKVGVNASVASSSYSSAATREESGASLSPSSSSPLPTSTVFSPSGNTSTMNAAEALATATASAACTSSNAKSGSTTCRLDEGVHLIRGSVLIERSSRRRIQNFPRHCVVCEPISMVFPPYRFCVPPEPAYLLAVRNEFVLYGITDVLLALSATSIFNAHRQAHLHNGGREVVHRVTESTADLSTSAANGNASTSSEAPSAPAELKPRGFPTSREELLQLVRKIPTHTVIQTDVLEVEVTTEYVCSNPASVSNDTSVFLSSTSAAAAAAGQRKKPSMDRAFTSTTPLKGGPTGPAGSESRRAGASSTDSPVSGPGSPLAENDDTKAHLFLYYVCVRNRGPQKNPHRWHAQILSHHLLVVDVTQAQVLEMGRPGVMGNFPLLPPGASHCFESGTTLSGPEGLIRGSIQVNLFNDVGEMMMLDAAIAPTRLTVEVTSAKGFTSVKSAKEELVQRTSEEDVSGAEERQRFDAGFSGTQL